MSRTYSAFVARVDKVAKKSKLSRATISRRLFNAGKKVDRLADGGAVYHSVFVEADAQLRAMEREHGIDHDAGA